MWCRWPRRARKSIPGPKAKPCSKPIVIKTSRAPRKPQVQKKSAALSEQNAAPPVPEGLQPSSIGAPDFPDISLEELKQRSCNITLQNSFVQGWELHKTALDPEYVAKHRHFVPAEVLALIPKHWRALIQDAAGIADGDGLWVLRDIDLLDQFAGKARACKWALLAGLKPVGFDITYGEHMV